LADIVIDADTSTEAGMGFVVTRASAVALLNTVAGGLTADYQPERWRALMWRTMGADFSWQRTARRYHAVYGEALDRARRGR
jgi:starch synthase